MPLVKKEMMIVMLEVKVRSTMMLLLDNDNREIHRCQGSDLREEREIAHGALQYA